MKCFIRADIQDVGEVVVDIPLDKIKEMSNEDWWTLFFDEWSKTPRRNPLMFPWLVTDEDGNELKVL